MESIHEEWRVIPGQSNYEVSDHGRIRSKDHVVIRRNRWRECETRIKGRVLNPYDNRGYFVVKFAANSTPIGVHQLVALAFIGPREKGMVVNHINGDKHDNRSTNLEYVTNRENVLHAYRTGLLNNSGENNGRHRAKLARVTT